MPHSPCAIANVFISAAHRKNKSLTRVDKNVDYGAFAALDPLQIPKMVFAAHGFSLALLAAPLVSESAVCIHNHGVRTIIFPSLAAVLGPYPLQMIESQLTDERGRVFQSDFSAQELSILDAIWSKQEEDHLENRDWYAVMLPFIRRPGVVSDSHIAEVFRHKLVRTSSESRAVYPGKEAA